MAWCPKCKQDVIRMQVRECTKPVCPHKPAVTGQRPVPQRQPEPDRPTRNAGDDAATTLLTITLPGSLL